MTKNISHFFAIFFTAICLLVVDNLKNKGAIFVEELEEINDKSRPVIFSAHGVPKKIPEDAENYKMTYVDATCPLVSKVHREAENLNKAGYHIILIGHENHPGWFSCPIKII